MFIMHRIRYRIIIECDVHAHNTLNILRNFLKNGKLVSLDSYFIVEDGICHQRIKYWF